MLKVELRKKIMSRTFIFSVFLLFFMFMLGSVGKMFGDYSEETVLSAIILKMRGKWVHNISSYRHYHMTAFWYGNEYIPVLMPIITGLTTLSLYMDETGGGNKRFVLLRTNKKNYYLSKCISSMIVAALAAFTAIILYWAMLFLFFDVPDISDSDFSLLYFFVTGSFPENPMAASVSDLNIVYLNAFKSMLRFLLYAMKCSLFCQAIIVLVKDRYLTLGLTVTASYIHIRIFEFFMERYFEKIVNGQEPSQLYQILSPTFLQNAGSDGFFKERLPLAIAIILALCILWISVYIAVSERQIDVAAG